jgi:hypothetical protein
MPHAIIRGKSGRCHEVDFEGPPLRVEIHASDESVEIFLEADSAELPEERRRFALINIPRHLFSQATAEAAKRKKRKDSVVELLAHPSTILSAGFLRR